MWVGYVLGQVASFFLTLLRMLPLAIANRLSRTRIPQEGDVVISLTSHGKRLNKVHFTLESIARGYTKAPIVLWLDEHDYNAPLPVSLQRRPPHQILEPIPRRCRHRHPRCHHR